MLDVPTDKLKFLEAYTPNQGPKNDHFHTKIYNPAATGIRKEKEKKNFDTQQASEKAREKKSDTLNLLSGGISLKNSLFYNSSYKGGKSRVKMQ